MPLLDESVLWGLVGLMGLWLVLSSDIGLWSLPFWALVLVLLVYLGQAKFFTGNFIVLDSWMALLGVGALAIFVLNQSFALGLFFNAGMVFLAFLLVGALKAESLMH